MSFNDLPGAEIILPGLSDLHSGESNTIGALLVAIAPLPTHKGINNKAIAKTNNR